MLLSVYIHFYGSIMAESLILHAQREPRIMNNGTIMGALAGALTGVPFGVLIGGAIGGLAGKLKIMNENKHGKLVRPPSMFNLKAVAGAMVGFVLGGLALTMIAMSATAAPTLLAALPSLMVGEAIGAAIGALVGGHRGKKEMAAEYNMAAQQAEVAHAEAMAAARSQEPQPLQEADLEHAPTHFLENELRRREASTARSR